MLSIILLISKVVFLKDPELLINLAPLGITKGECFLVLSFLSLNLISSKIFRYIDFSPLSINCLYLLFALIFTSTSIYSLRNALLNTTEPMSLPSITNPSVFFIVFVANLCCLFIYFLTNSNLAISDAIAPIFSFLRDFSFVNDN